MRGSCAPKNTGRNRGGRPGEETPTNHGRYEKNPSVSQDMDTKRKYGSHETYSITITGAASSKGFVRIAREKRYG